MIKLLAIQRLAKYLDRKVERGLSDGYHGDTRARQTEEEGHLPKLGSSRHIPAMYKMPVGYDRGFA